MDDVFKALADPNRRALLDSLNEQNGQSLRELCARLSMTRQSVSKHLAVLESAHLVITLIDDDDVILCLQELNLADQIYGLRDARGPAGIVGSVDMLQADFRFGVFLDDLARPRLQDRIVEIAAHP